MKLRRLIAATLLSAGILTVPVAVPEAMAASEIRYVVNGLPVTSYDIARRVALLRLQRTGGNLKEKAATEMVEQALKDVEMRRLKVNVSSATVESAFANFAKQNRLTVKQMTQILNQAGITAKHFREFIRVQIGWNQVLSARFRAEGVISEQDVVQKMLQQGGKKPVATEYMLQQVIFVVPAAERGRKLNQRVKEANSMRQRFTGCDTTREFAKGLIDVTVRDLGRVLEPELPPDWADLIKETSQGGATKVRKTDRGVEFIGICSSREVSDDRVAQMVFSNEGDDNERAKEFSDKYLSELRQKARISKR